MNLPESKKLKDLETVIAKAIKKVGASKENDLCKYLPIETGGYMHHFTLKKLKYKNPQELASIIEEFIIKAERPIAVPPKARAPRGSRKRRNQLGTFPYKITFLLYLIKNRTLPLLLKRSLQ